MSGTFAGRDVRRDLATTSDARSHLIERTLVSFSPAESVVVGTFVL